MFTRCLTLLTLTLPFYAHAEAPKASYVQPPPVISADGMLQMVMGLLLVLAIIIAIAWLLKRFAILPTATSSTLKVIASAGVGQRERVVLVEVGDTWLVLGVAPGRVNTLHSLEKSSIESAKNSSTHSSNGNFPEHLNQSMEKNHDR
tara:strand:+ start:2445 stop:2885 length:441 start_codon:yes stop_codon:yes gene_type:complete